MGQVAKVTLEDELMLKSTNGRIKLLKREKGLTDKDIADLTNYHEKSINRKLNSGAPLSDDVIIKLSERFEVSPEFLKMESNFRTQEEHDLHVLNTRYHFIKNMLRTIEHLNIYVKPHIFWSIKDINRFDCLESIAKTIDVEDGKYEDNGMPVELDSIISSKDFEYIGCMDKSSREWILEYEKYYMNKSNLYLFQEICRNEERIALIPHEKFLKLIDDLNNCFASSVALLLESIRL